MKGAISFNDINESLNIQREEDRREKNKETREVIGHRLIE